MAKRVKPQTDVLNVRQRAFVTAYLEHGNATKAAIGAGYSAHTAAVQGSGLIRNPKIVAALEAAQEKAVADSTLTAKSVLDNIESVREKAIQDNNLSAALKALELQGKALKLFFEGHVMDDPARKMTDDDIRARLAQIGARTPLQVVGADKKAA